MRAPEPGRNCPLCPRLVEFRKDWRRKEPTWFNAPVPSFGPADARVLIVGLAPLGRIAHDSVLSALGVKKSAYAFSHGCRHEIGGLNLFSSYHCSRYNTNTGVLTPEMFRDVFAQVRAFLDR